MVSTRIRSTMLLLSIAGGAGVQVAQAQVQMPRFGPDVVAQFNALSKRPDPMGFEIADGPDPSQCRHHQALIRTEAADGTPYFLVTRSGPPRDFCPEEESGLGGGDPIANLYVVRMGSRETHGERLRSNRLQRAMRTTDTPPDSRDRVVRSIPYNGAFDGTRSFWPPYDHPGGMQQVGNIVVIGVEFPPLIWVDEPLPHQIPDPTMAPVLVQFVDVSDPENPEIRSTFAPGEADARAGVAALTPCSANRVGVPCATGRYLLAISGGNNSTVHFYESTTSDLADPLLWWTHLYTWRKEELIPSDVCIPRPIDFGPPIVPAVECWHAHQTMQFVREGDLSGALYLAGARGPGRNDPDFIDLYRVELEGGVVRITQVGTKHLVSHPAWEGEVAGERIASLAAASTFHVTPSGELLFYASEHDNDGPEGTNGRSSVKMGEWRHSEIARPGSPTVLPSVQAGGPYAVNEGSSVLLTAIGRPPITKAWIQLYEHPGYDGRYLVIEYDDRNKDDFNDFRLLDPNFAPPFVNAIDPDAASDEASSWRWFAPVGCTIRANDDDYDDPTEPPGDATRTLAGEGFVRRDHDLGQIPNDSGTGFVEDTFTSVQFFTVPSVPDCDGYYNAPIALLWDLDLDGSRETSGEQAAFAAEEGPAIVQVPVEAIQSVSSGLSHVMVTIINVAPSIDSALALDPAGRAIGTQVPFVLQGRRVTIARHVFGSGAPGSPGGLGGLGRRHD